MMTEQILETPKPEANVQTEQPVGEKSQQPKQEDLLSRVTRFVETENPAKKSDEKINEEYFNDAELRQKIDSIEDEALRTQFASLRKSLMRGANEKFQEIAEIRKELQGIKEGLNGNKGWSPDRVKQLINDPEFLKAAQPLITPEEEYETEHEKHLKQELSTLKQEFGQWKDTLTSSQREHAHQVLSEKYSNYDKNVIDTIHKNILENKVMPTYVDIYKAYKHDENLTNAYRMGRQDERNGIGEKERASSFEGVNQTPNSEIKPEENESDKQFMNRIIQKNLALLKRK